MTYRQLPFADGIIEYVVDGPDDARDLLLFHLGTPCAAVPFDGLHGRWLARTIPGARAVFPAGAGHTSIMVPFDEIVGQLVEAGAT